MPSVITHSLVGVALGKAAFVRRMDRLFWDLIIVAVLIPDIDVFGFRMHVPYGAFWGHRGFTHSLFFALIVGVVISSIYCWRRRVEIGGWWRYLLFFTAVAASNGLLDAMTNGGYGVALFAPFDDTRYFLPWRPIEVSPISLQGFLSGRGFDVLLSELVWIWLPAIVAVVIVRLVRRRFHRSSVNG